MKILKTYAGLPKSVYILFFAQIINRFGDFVMPFLTLFLTKHLGFSNKAAGLSLLIAILASIPGAFIGGKIADHYGRKKTYMIFQGTAGLAILLCTFTRNPFIIITLISISAFFNGGVRPIITAIMTDVLTPEDRHRGFSLTYLGINIGVAIGPLLAGFLFNHYLFMIFIGDAITTVLAVFLVALNIKETMPFDKDQQNETCMDKDTFKSEDHLNTQTISELEKSETGTIFHVLKRRPYLLLFLIFNTLYSITYSQHSFSMPLMLNHIFGDLGPTYFGTLMSVNAITVVVMTMVVTHCTRKCRSITGIILGGAAYFIGFGMISFSTTLIHFWISTFVWTIGEILIVTNFGVYISNNTPQNFRARISAVTSLSWATGSMFGTYGMGIFMDATGVEAVWPMVSFIALIGTFGMMGIRQYEIKQEKNLKSSQYIPLILNDDKSA